MCKIKTVETFENAERRSKGNLLDGDTAEKVSYRVACLEGPVGDGRVHVVAKGHAGSVLVLNLSH